MSESDRVESGTEALRDNHQGDLRLLQNVAEHDANVSRDDVVGCEECMGAFLAVSEPNQCPFCRSTEALR